MLQQELLIRVVRILDDLGIDYMVTGSYASAIQGQPRSTHGIDLVVALTRSAGDQLVEVSPNPEYYLSPAAIQEAIERRGMFNVIHTESGYTVDFWMVKDTLFDITCFARKRLEEAWGMMLKVSTPEDTIRAKLRWAKQSGGSEKQFNDCLHVYEIQQPGLDMAYLEDWASRLGVTELWERLKSEATQD